MTIESIPGSDVKYYLVAYDKNGHERTDDPDATNEGVLSYRVKQEINGRKELNDSPVTDVFFMSHGWKGDVPAAKEQYTRWIGAMLECDEDLKKVHKMRPGFRPLLVGLHWPSQPWGDEELDTSGMTFGVNDDPLASLIDDAAEKIADTDAAKEALRTIFIAAEEDINPQTLPTEVVEAFKVLQHEAGLDAQGPAAAPGADAEEFDPERYYQADRDDAVSFRLPGVGGLLSVLRQLSFWKMKDRARKFGENGAGLLLRELQQSAGDRDIRFHLMGHSFGCIVMSAAVAGAGGNTPLVKPVDSLFLVQGALSLWAYCSDIPFSTGKSGYFHMIVGDNKVAGPIVTTQSEHDTAVGRLYPIAAGLKRQIIFGDTGELPKYGALGSFGIRGPGVTIEDINMLSMREHYGLKSGTCYNVESSHIIREGEGASGAHSDIDRPEVAHLLWAAVMA